MKKKEKVAPVQRAKADIIRETLFAATPPEDISESVIKRDMVNNIICYKRHKNNRYADYHCQQCGAEYTLCTDYDDPLYQCEIPVINHEFTCPKCGEKGTLKYLCNIKNTRYYYNTVTYRLLPDTTLVITLYWSLVKRYIYGIRSIETHESYRVYLKRNSVKIYEWCYWKNQWNQVQKIKYINTNTRNSEALGTGNIGHSDLSYCQLKEMAMATFGRLYLINNQNECNIMVLMAYAKYPGIETLFKNGLSDIVKVVILRGSSNLTSKKETKANRILGISKEQYHWLVNYDGDSYIALNMMKKYHIDIKDMPYVTRILSYRLGGRRFDFNTSMDNLTYAHQYLSYCQIYNYLSRQNENNGITLYELLNEYVDYLKMRQALEYDMTNPVYIRPKSLRMTYAALRREYKREKNTIYEKEMAIKYSQIAAVARKIQKKYSWQDGTLLIRPAASAIEIVREGRILHHCVGNDEQRYMDNYNKNKAYILVIRHLDTPDTPYITVEIEKNNHIRQWYGKNDKKPDKKQIEKFLEDYADYLNKRVRIAV